MNGNKPASPLTEKVLVIQLARFGDFLQTTPLLAALKASRPRSETWALVAAAQVEVARANPHVDRVLTIDLRRLENLAQNPGLGLGERVCRFDEELAFLKSLAFDSIINLNTSRVAALLADLPRASHRAGPRLAEDRTRLTVAPWAAFIMNMLTRRRLIRFNLVDLLACYADLDARAGDGLVYPVDDAGRQAASDMLPSIHGGPLVGFQVGSRHKTRQWPPEYFAELARSLIEDHQARIVLLGIESEKPIGREFLSLLETIAPSAPRHVIDLMGRTSVSELAGLLSRLDLLVTTDTGTMHLAAAVRCRILALFMGPAFCHETGPYGAGHLILQAVEPCSPCLEGSPTCREFPCRTRITPEIARLSAASLLFPERPESGSARIDGIGVRPYISELDDFGVVYRPRTPHSMDREELLALAYREAGRTFMRPGYRLGVDLFERESNRYRSRPDAGTVRALLESVMQIRRVLADAPKPGIRRYDMSPELPAEFQPLFRTARAVALAGDTGSARRLIDHMAQALVTISGTTDARGIGSDLPNSTIVQSGSISL